MSLRLSTFIPCHTLLSRPIPCLLLYLSLFNKGRKLPLNKIKWFKTKQVTFFQCNHTFICFNVEQLSQLKSLEAPLAFSYLLRWSVHVPDERCGTAEGAKEKMTSFVKIFEMLCFVCMMQFSLRQILDKTWTSWILMATFVQICKMFFDRKLK